MCVLRTSFTYFCLLGNYHFHSFVYNWLFIFLTSFCVIEGSRTISFSLTTLSWIVPNTRACKLSLQVTDNLPISDGLRTEMRHYAIIESVWARELVSCQRTPQPRIESETSGFEVQCVILYATVDSFWQSRMISE